MSHPSPPLSPRILIAGCGYVGTALAQQLAASGTQAFGLRRHPEHLPPEIHRVAADLGDPASLSVLPERLDAVVYAAAADGRSAAAYRLAYVDGLQNLVTAIRARQGELPRLLYVSSTGVYSQHDGQWVDEDTDPESRSETSKLLLAGEHLCRSLGPEASVLRLGGIYGPGRRRLIDRVLAGEAPCPSGPPLYTNRIHLDDIVGALTHLLRITRPLPLYLGVDHAPSSTCEVVHWMAEKLDAPPPKTSAEVAPESNKRCRNGRLVASGYAFRYPSYREGYTQVLRQLGLLTNTAATDA